MPGRAPEVGPTSDAVATNVKRLREAQHLNYSQLSRLLMEQAHWNIPALSIRRIEDGSRQVTVDDLVALAVALKTSPATLLMPVYVSSKSRAKVTGTMTQSALNIWNWLTARNALKGEASSGELIEFWLRSWPTWEHDHMGEEITRRKNRITKGRTNGNR